MHLGGPWARFGPPLPPRYDSQSQSVGCGLLHPVLPTLLDHRSRGGSAAEFAQMLFVIEESIDGIIDLSDVYLNEQLGLEARDLHVEVGCADPCADLRRLVSRKIGLGCALRSPLRAAASVACTSRARER